VADCDAEKAHASLSLCIFDDLELGGHCRFPLGDDEWIIQAINANAIAKSGFFCQETLTQKPSILCYFGTAFAYMS
jgi:hypothetical protein